MNYKPAHEEINIPGMAIKPIDNNQYVPRYSTDVAAAWSVSDKFHHVSVESTDIGYKATLTLDHVQGCGSAETMPIAVCIAALNAYGIDVVVA